MPGVAYMDHGARVDRYYRRARQRGCHQPYSSGNAPPKMRGQATSGFLVEVEKVSMAQMEEWRQQYPEAFEREYDPASGLRFNAWVEGGIKQMKATVE